MLLISLNAESTKQNIQSVLNACFCPSVCVSIYLPICFHLSAKYRWWSGTTDDFQREKRDMITQQMERSMHVNLHVFIKGGSS